MVIQISPLCRGGRFWIFFHTPMVVGGYRESYGQTSLGFYLSSLVFDEGYDVDTNGCRYNLYSLSMFCYDVMDADVTNCRRRY